MVEIRHTHEFKLWLIHQRGKRARGLVLAHVDRLHLGLPSDVHEVRPGMYEMRIEQGLGYRLYFVYLEPTTLVMLTAGDTRTQDRDIQLATKLAINI
ncbi:MAG TPA: type II toxin-antitoxin system RelE/ParE family toxin [Burkholderiaceae bacterium]